ncbi:hypothetical protein DRP05_14675 [Archaeoglobales archaeon]|nr:MAG: hypothetical protein DRP05_14675 [Archaeoglobales archaeon]
MINTSIDIPLILQILTAIGTFSMAVLLFYIEVIKGWLKRPKIRIEFRQEEPYCKEVPLEDLQNIPSYWIRIKVENIGKQIAKGVEGRLVEIKDKNGNSIKEFVPLILRWASRPYSKIPDIQDVRMDINRGASWFLDVIYIADVAKLKSSEKERYKIWGQRTHICDIYMGLPTGTLKDLDPGEYYLTITIYGDNIKPLSKTFRLTWGGKYRDIIFKVID